MLIKLSRGASAIAACVLVVMLVLMVSDVVGRAVFADGGVTGVIEIQEILLVFATCLAFALTQRQNGHISTDVLIRRLPPRVSKTMQMIGLGVATLLLLWLTVTLGFSAADSIRTGEHRFGVIKVPMWPARVALCVGLLLFTFETARTLIQLAKTPLDKLSESAEEPLEYIP